VGKEIKIGPAERIECFAAELEGFMSDVFGFAPGSYLVTDGSRLVDFFPAGLSGDAIDQAETLEAAYSAWDAWVLGVIEQRYGIRPQATTVLMPDLMWMIGRQGRSGQLH
jgi:hypothetical protein